MMRTVALATNAPLGSCTVPVIAPVAPPCPKAAPASADEATPIAMNCFQEPSMVVSPIAYTVIKLFSQKNHERKASTTAGSPCLGSDRRGPHPIVLSTQESFLFCPERYKYSPAVKMASWDEKSLLNRPAIFQG